MLVKSRLKLLTLQAKLGDVRHIAALTAEGNYSAVVLIHSLNYLEPGYQDMVDRMATDRFVAFAPQWQTCFCSPSDSGINLLSEISTGTQLYRYTALQVHRRTDEADKSLS